MLHRSILTNMAERNTTLEDALALTTRRLESEEIPIRNDFIDPQYQTRPIDSFRNAVLRIMRGNQMKRQQTTSEKMANLQNIIKEYMEKQRANEEESGDVHEFKATLRNILKATNELVGKVEAMTSSRKLLHKMKS